MNMSDVVGIRLENVGVIDIIEGNRNIILGLIWSLIVHYQLHPTMRKIPRGASWKPTAPKHQLLEWVRASFLAYQQALSYHHRSNHVLVRPRHSSWTSPGSTNPGTMASSWPPLSRASGLIHRTV